MPSIPTFARLGSPRLARLLGAWTIAMTILASTVWIDARSAKATPTIGNGDCWKFGTPLNCRNTWSGAGQLVLLRVIDQLGSDSLGRALWQDTVTAYSNWNVPQGAQSFRDYARTNDTWIYVKRNDNLPGTCNGLTVNFGYINGVLDSSTNPKNIIWSEVFLTKNNRLVQCYSVSVPIAGHELGHTLGLAHSSNSSSIMKSGTTLSSPNVALDIAADATCVGEKGVSCIFATN